MNPPKEHRTDKEFVGIFAELSTGEYVFLDKFISFDYKVVFFYIKRDDRDLSQLITEAAGKLETLTLKCKRRSNINY